MYKKQKEMLVAMDIKDTWDFLINYEWSTLIKGDKVVKETTNKWLIYLGKDDRANIQEVEVKQDENLFVTEITITPRYNKYGSYDSLIFALESRQEATNITAIFEYCPKSFMERVFAIILNHEEHIFDEASKELFDEINKSILKNIYGK